MPTFPEQNDPLPTSHVGRQTISSSEANKANGIVNGLQTKLGPSASVPAAGQVLKGTGAGNTAWDLPTHAELVGVDTDAGSTAIHHTLGTTAVQAAPGNHNHTGLTPAAHGFSHESGGSDPIAAEGLLPQVARRGEVLGSDPAASAGRLWYNSATALLKYATASVVRILEHQGNKDQASGYAGLDGSTKLAGAQLPYGAIANTAAQGNDARLSDARAPTAHATTHQPGGSDAMAVDAAVGVGSLRTLGTGALQAAVGTHTHAHAALTGVDTDVATSSIHHTIGASATQAAAGNHAHAISPLVVTSVKTTNQTAVVTDDVLRMDASGASRTVTMPAGNSWVKDRPYIVRKEDSNTSNTVTISVTGGGTINGAASIILSEQFQAAALVSDGTNYMTV